MKQDRRANANAARACADGVLQSHAKRRTEGGGRSWRFDDSDGSDNSGQLNSAGAFVAMLRKMTMLTERFEITHLFVDGERACCVFDLVTATPIGKSPAAEYFELREGRIAALRAHYDSQPWVALAGAGEAH